jgi:hypothetical protein
MDPICFPPYGNPIAYYADPGDIKFKAQLIMSVTEQGGKLRPLDICDECNEKIMQFIFNDEVTKNG